MPPGTTDIERLEAYESVAQALRGAIGMAQIEVDMNKSKTWEGAILWLNDALRDLEELKP